MHIYSFMMRRFLMNDSWKFWTQIQLLWTSSSGLFRVLNDTFPSQINIFLWMAATPVFSTLLIFHRTCLWNFSTILNFLETLFREFWFPWNNITECFIISYTKPFLWISYGNILLFQLIFLFSQCRKLLKLRFNTNFTLIFPLLVGYFSKISVFNIWNIIVCNISCANQKTMLFETPSIWTISIFYQSSSQMLKKLFPSLYSFSKKLKIALCKSKIPHLLLKK